MPEKMISQKSSANGSGKGGECASGGACSLCGESGGKSCDASACAGMSSGCGCGGMKSKCGRHRGFGHMIIKTLVGILIAYVIVWVASVTRNNLRKFYYIGKMDRPQNTISITGDGKATAVPNTATVSVGLTVGKPDVASAQKENIDKMNVLISGIKGLGVADADIQTNNYQIYPTYDYTGGKTTITGYTVSQGVTVKIRDLSKISAVLDKAGAVGANQVGNLQFVVDDPKAVQAEARALALSDAQSKAQTLAAQLGVQLVRVVSFNEYAPQGGPEPRYLNAEPQGADMGGAAPSAPSIETGSNEVHVQVNVIYEIE